MIFDKIGKLIEWGILIVIIAVVFEVFFGVNIITGPIMAGWSALISLFEEILRGILSGLNPLQVIG